MSTVGETRGTAGAKAAAGDLTGAIPWFVLVVVLVVGGLFFAARAGDAYTHASGLLFAGFGLLFGARLLHRLLP